MDTLLIVDGHALIHRAYHALPAFKTKDGVPTNALYGFVTMLDTAIKEFRATHVVVCLDTPAKTFRDELFPDYRAHRPQVDQDLIKQFPMVTDFLRASHITFVEQEGYEADDLIATIATTFKEDSIVKLILTGDKDIMQLVNAKHRIMVIAPQNGNKTPLMYDEDAVIKRFHIRPDQIADYKALAGDPSDNYKGVGGIGPKTATDLISKFGSVEDIYEHIEEVENLNVKEKLKVDKENALMSKKLAQLVYIVPVDVDLEKLKFSGYNEELKNFFDEYQFRSLKRRFFNEPLKGDAKEKKNQLGLF